MGFNPRLLLCCRGHTNSFPESDTHMKRVGQKYLPRARLSDCQTPKGLKSVSDTRLVRDPHVGIAGVTSECEISKAVQKAHIKMGVTSTKILFLAQKT